MLSRKLKQLFFSESQCQCENELYNARVSVNAPNVKAFSLNVFNNFYTSATAFMAKQGMTLTNFGSESHSVIPEEPCYYGEVEGGEYELGDGKIGKASIAFRLLVSVLQYILNYGFRSALPKFRCSQFFSGL